MVEVWEWIWDLGAAYCVHTENADTDQRRTKYIQSIKANLNFVAIKESN